MCVYPQDLQIVPKSPVGTIDASGSTRMIPSQSQGDPSLLMSLVHFFAQDSVERAQFVEFLELRVRDLLMGENVSLVLHIIAQILEVLYEIVLSEQIGGLFDSELPLAEIPIGSDNGYFLLNLPLHRNYNS